MHLLIVTQYYWPESFRINDIAEELVARGHQVTVLTGMPNYPQGVRYSGYGILKPRTEMHNGVKILRLPIIARGRGGHKRLFFNYLSFVLSASILGPWRTREKYDAILVYAPSPITQALPAIVLKFFKRIPLLLNVQDLWPESVEAVGAVKSPRLRGWVGKLVRFIYRRCDWLLVPSRAFEGNVVEFGGDRNTLEYWPNMADDAFVEREESAQNRVDALVLSVPAGFRVMFAGNIGEAQDFPTILKAAAQLKQDTDIQFVIVGQGRKREWAEAQVAERGLSNTVHFVGQFPYEKMPQLYAQADVLLVTLKPTHIFTLTVPSKVQSYLSSSKPIVAALDGEGASVILDAQAGKVGPAGDAIALANNIRSLFNLTVEEREALGSNGRQYFLAHYTRGIVVDQLESRLKHFTELQTARFSKNGKEKVDNL